MYTFIYTLHISIFDAFTVKCQSMILSFFQKDISYKISYISVCSKTFLRLRINQKCKIYPISNLNNSKTPKEQLKVE